MHSKNNFLNRRQGGQAMLIAVVFFLFISLAIVSGFVSPTVREFKISTDLIKSKQSIFLAESGVEDVLYRAEQGFAVSEPEVLSLNDSTVTTSTTGLYQQGVTLVVITSQGDVSSRRRKTKLRVNNGDNVLFPYKVHAGDGGISITGAGGIIGADTFSNGPVIGAASNTIGGNVISAGSDGSVNWIRTTLSMWSHTIANAVIKDHAYYQSISGSTVNSAACPNPNCHPGSGDVSDIPLPITDAHISVWETAAAAAGNSICSLGTYTISVDTTLGPKVVPCNLLIKGTAVLTLTGPIWVQGNITMQGTSSMKVDPALGNVSIPVIADNPSDHISSSKISIGTAALAVTAFVATGGNGSSVFLVSQHNGAETGQPVNGVNYDAITANLSSFGGDIVLYARHGNIALGKTVVVKQIAGYKITVSGTVAFRSIIDSFDPIFIDLAGNWTFLNWNEIK